MFPSLAVDGWPDVVKLSWLLPLITPNTKFSALKFELEMVTLSEVEESDGKNLRQQKIITLLKLCTLNFFYSTKLVNLQTINL